MDTLKFLCSLLMCFSLSRVIGFVYREKYAGYLFVVVFFPLSIFVYTAK